MTVGLGGRRLALAGGLAAIAIGVAACNNSTPGQANPASGGTGGSIPTTTASSTTNGLPVAHACSLVSSGDLAQFGVSAPPTQQMVGTAHACEFESTDYSMAVAIRTDVGLDGFTSSGGTVHDMTVGSHKAKQEVDSTGSCVIGIGVSNTSRVDITATGDGTNDPCPTALKLAGLVEPKLP